MKQYSFGTLLGILLMIPVISLLSLLHELIGHAHLPVELLHSTLGLAATNVVLFAEQAFVIVPYALWGIFVTLRAYLRHRQRAIAMSLKSPIVEPVKLGSGFKVGIWVALPLIIITGLFAPTIGQSLVAILLIIALFLGWGYLYHYLFNELWWRQRGVDRKKVAAGKNSEGADTTVSPPNPLQLGRRPVLIGLATLGVALIGAISGRFLHLNRRLTLATKANVPEHFPPTLIAKVYPTHTGPFQFPEQLFPRYQPTSHPIGICFSGGGPRAMSCAMGQMRGLEALGLLDSIGTISSVSGGGWFSTLFTYAPTEIDDKILLGSIVEPEAITLALLTDIHPQNIAAPLIHMTDQQLLYFARDTLRTLILSDTQAYNRFYSRLLNEGLLLPFGLDHPHKFFTLTEESLQNIIARNPTLQPSQFYTARPNRPFLICGGTHLYPPGPDRVLRAFEYSALYSGMFQFSPKSGHDNADLGGGYIENLAFDSTTPVDYQPTTNMLTVSTPEPIFLLSDMLGSTSSGPDVILDYYAHPELLPEFHLLSLVNPDQQPAAHYDIYDGSNIENIGIIPLLRRQYPVVLAFVNASVPLGATHPDAVEGVTSQISRLFGFPTPFQAANFDDTQIFPKEQFAPLVAGLKSAHQAGKLAIYTDSYEIIQPNLFELTPYPDSQKVTVVWFYNDLNEAWYQKLSPEVQALLTNTDPTNRMDNFPHFGTVNQNKTAQGIPQLLYYSPEQINLLAHMWSYNILHEAKDTLLNLK